jgi:hypothetical protein
MPEIDLSIIPLRALGVADALAGGRHRLREHLGVADVIGEEQDELRVDERALLVGEAAMRRDQPLVEVVGAG